MKLVRSVEYATADSVHATWIGNAVVTVTESTVWEELQVKPFPTLKISDKLEDKQRVWTSQLELLTCGPLPADKPLVFRLGLANGKFLLLGDGERPYTVIETTEDIPETAAENQLTEVKVTLVSNRKTPYIR